MKLADIADHIGGVLEGDGSIDICGLSSLSEASAADITFLANRKYASDVATTSASAVLVGKDWEGDCPCALLRVDDVDNAYSQVGVLMSPPPICFCSGI